MKDLIEQLYALSAAGKIDDALDVSFEFIDDLLCGDHFDECNELLASVDPSRLLDEILVGLLVITYPARLELRSRPALLEQAMKRLSKEDWLPEMRESALAQDSSTS